MGEEPGRLREAKSKLEYLRYDDGNFTPLDSTDAEVLLAEVERLAGEREQIDRNYAAVCAECESLGDDNERLAGERDEGYDEGRESVLNAPVCSKCGRNHDADESAMCEGGEVILFRDLPAECERLTGRVAAVERTNLELMDERDAQHARFIEACGEGMRVSADLAQLSEVTREWLFQTDMADEDDPSIHDFYLRVGARWGKGNYYRKFSEAVSALADVEGPK